MRLSAKEERELIARVTALEKQNALLRSLVGYTGAFQANGGGLVDDQSKTKLEIRQVRKEVKEGLAKIEAKVLRQGKKGDAWTNIFKSKTFIITACVSVVFLIVIILQSVGFPVNDAVKGVLGN